MRKSVYEDNYTQITSCLRNVRQRGLMEIFLDVNADRMPPPLVLFKFKSLNLLNLGKGFVLWSKIFDDAFLPQLQTLVLDSVCFYALQSQRCGLDKLLSISPVIESLELHDIEWGNWKWGETISSSSLTRLELHHNLNKGFAGNGYRKMSFDLPCLQTLHYSDFVPDTYVVVNLQSLITAKLKLLLTVNHEFYEEVDEDDDIITSNPTEFLKGIQNVQSLELGTPYSLLTFNLFREALPMFGKLINLIVNSSNSKVCWSFLPVLIANAPKLKSLTIEGLLHLTEDDEVCSCLDKYLCLSSCAVEVLRIEGFEGSLGEINHLKHFLLKCSALSLVDIVSQVRDKENRSRVEESVMNLPKLSTKCKVTIRFSWLW